MSYYFLVEKHLHKRTQPNFQADRSNSFVVRNSIMGTLHHWFTQFHCGRDAECSGGPFIVSFRIRILSNRFVKRNKRFIQFVFRIPFNINKVRFGSNSMNGVLIAQLGRHILCRAVGSTWSKNDRFWRRKVLLAHKYPVAFNFQGLIDSPSH